MSLCELPEGIDQFLSPYDIQRMMLKFWAIKNRMPFYATLELTPLCNFRCSMCYVRLDRAEMQKQGRPLSAAQWLEITRQLAEMGMLDVNISGGEPLIRPDFWEIYEGIIRQGIYPSIFTNGALIDERVVERLLRNPPRGIKLSLYGGCNETYETMCGDPHGFDKVSHAIDLIREAGIPLKVTSTVTRQNRQDEILLREFAAERQIPIEAVSELNESQRGASSDVAGARIEEDIDSWTMEQVEKHMRREEIKRPYDRCAIAEWSTHITWQGHMQSCGFISDQYVQLAEPYDLRSAWKQLQDMVDALEFPPECTNCPDARFCLICPGELSGASGSVTRTSPSLCARAAKIHARYRTLLEETGAGCED